MSVCLKKSVCFINILLLSFLLLFRKKLARKIKKNKKTLKYLQLQENITKPHNIWHSVKNSEIDVKAGEIKAKIATQTYMVQCQKSKFVKNAAATCPLCGTKDEDLGTDHLT